MKEQNKTQERTEQPLLYRSSEINGDLLPRSGEDSRHLVLFRFAGESESGCIGAETYEGIDGGCLVNEGSEASYHLERSTLRVYQGLKPSTARELHNLVYRSHDLTNRSGIDGEAIMRVIERKILKPEAQPTPLKVVEDKNWVWGYKCTPEVQTGERA